MRRTPLCLAVAAALALPGVAGAAVSVSTETPYPVFVTDERHVAADTNGGPDFHARINGETRLLTSGLGTGKDLLEFASPDGSISYFSTEEALLPADTDAVQDIYVRGPLGLRLATPGTETYVNMAGTSDDGTLAFLRIEDDVDPADTDGNWDYYAYAAASGTLTLVSPGTTAQPGFAGASPDGATVYVTASEPLTPDDDDAEIDTFAFSGGTYTKLTPGSKAAIPVAMGHDTPRLVVRTTEALVAADKDDKPDLYTVHNGTAVLRSPSVQAPAAAQNVDFLMASRDDADAILFSTAEALLAADGDTNADIYRHDGSKLSLLTPGTSQPVAVADASDDLETVMLSSVEQLKATDTDTKADLYYAVNGGYQHLVTTDGPFPQERGLISPDGLEIAFETAEALVAEDTDGDRDVYVRGAGAPELVSGTGGGDASLSRYLPDGSVLFTTAQALVAEDADTDPDAYLRAAGQPVLVSVAPQKPGGGAGGGGVSKDPVPTPTATPVATSTPVATPTATPPVADTTPPVVRARVRVVKRRPTLRVTVDEAAVVKVRVTRRGKRFAGRTVTVPAGTHKLRLRRIARRGAFRLTLVATDAAGNASVPAKLALRR